MNKLFIDTNIFIKKGLNFDKNNIWVKLLVDGVKKKSFEYCNLSIIDMEIKSHIMDRCNNKYNKLKRDYNWVNNYIKQEDLIKNCYKDSTDYENFKKSINAKDYDVSNINSEKVFEKYFLMKLPFENNIDKKSEFPDAFISEFINNMKENTKDDIYFISNDRGLCKSLNYSVKKFNSIEEFFIKMNRINSFKYIDVKEYLMDHIEDLQNNILKRLVFNTSNILLEINAIRDIELSSEFIINVLEANDDVITIKCTFENMVLVGDFACLDYDDLINYCDIEDYKPIYINISELNYDNFEFNINIVEKDRSFEIEYDKTYPIELEYKNIYG